MYDDYNILIHILLISFREKHYFQSCLPCIVRTFLEKYLISCHGDGSKLNCFVWSTKIEVLRKIVCFLQAAHRNILKTNAKHNWRGGIPYYLHRLLKDNEIEFSMISHFKKCIIIKAVAVLIGENVDSQSHHMEQMVRDDGRNI